MTCSNAIILYVVGAFLFSVILAHLPISCINKHLHEIRIEQSISRAKRNKTDSFNWLEGLVERTLFLIFFQIESGELILAWLALKTAINVIYKQRLSMRELDIRTSYNIFLVGTGANLIFSFVGSMIIKWGQIIIINKEKEQLLLVFIVPVLVLILSLCVCYIVNRDYRKIEKKKGDGCSCFICKIFNRIS